MNSTVVNFMLESGISLAVFVLVYLLFLRKETFFFLNRIYLLGSVCFSILLPFIHFQVISEMPTIMLDEVTITAKGYQNVLQTVFVYSTNLSVSIEKTIQSIGLIRFIYLVGTAIFFLVFLYRLLQITALILKNNESEVNNGVRIIKIDRDTTPFSFFNFVFISKNNGDSQGMREMLAHEFEHVRQGHSYDVMILELLTIFQWFNPFIWLLKRSIRENHEFLADNGVLKPEVSSAAYRMLLLNSAFIQQPVIANNFNYSLIKNRIKMITKIKSSKTAVLKLSMGIIVTAALLVIFAFDNEKDQMQNKKTVNKLANVVVDSVVVDRKKQSLQKDEQIFIVVEQPASFQNSGVDGFQDWVKKNLNYPTIAKEKGIAGKVYIQFAVNTAGKVVDVKVVRSANPLLDEEAVRLVKSSPKWEPAKQRGTKVKQQFTLPIAFVNDEQKSQQTGEQVFIVVEQQASFQGGNVDQFCDWVNKNLKYPDIAIKKGISGKVYVQYAVNSKGEVVDVKVVRGVDPSLDKEAVRVISSSPKWEPAKQKGTIVKQQFTIPIAFALK